MIYYQDIVQAEPGMMADYLNIFAEQALPSLLERGNHPIGMYRVVPGTGKYNEVIFINGIDSWSRWGKDVLTTEGHPIKEEWHAGVRKWAETAFEYRKQWVKNFYRPASFAPTYQQLEQRGKQGSTFIHTMYRVAPGKLVTYLRFYEERLLPAYREHGIELIGLWHIFPGTGPSNQVFELKAIDQWDDWGRIVGAQTSDKTFARVLESALDYRGEWDDRILLPAPWAMVQ